VDVPGAGEVKLRSEEDDMSDAVGAEAISSSS